MKKNALFFTFILFVILLAGCGGNDELGECNYDKRGKYKCSGDKSYWCGRPDSDYEWVFQKDCEYGCSAGKCLPKPCTQTIPVDSGSNLMWSSKVERKSLDNATKYCENLEENGYNDWRLPNIDALRTLIQNCPNTSPNGKCAVSNECLTTGGYTDDCKICGASNTAISKLGDSEKFWSSSICADGCYYRSAWSVDFSSGEIFTEVIQLHYATKTVYVDQDLNVLQDIRCVRTKKTEGGSNNQNPCDPNPCIGVANSTEVCIAVNMTKYLCECEDGFTWNKTSCDIWCDKSNMTPCKDAETNFMWSANSTSEMTWDEAKSYCEALGEGNYDNWRFPSIDELRSLIDGCSNTKQGGKCKVSATNGCLSSKDCWDSSCNSCGQTSAATISKFGDSDIFWSSSIRSDRNDSAWYVDFSDGKVHNEVKSNSYYVRCVR